VMKNGSREVKKRRVEIVRMKGIQEGANPT
jgi:hypothetical protein